MGLRLVAAGCAAVLFAGIVAAAADGQSAGPGPSVAARSRASRAAHNPVPPMPRVPRAAPAPRAARLLYPLPARAVQPEPCPAPPIPLGPAGPPLGPPRVAESAIPWPALPPRRHVDLTPILGKGIWLTLWPGSTLDPARVVAQARAAGLTQLWVRTGGSDQGFYGRRDLAGLLPAAHRAGLAVIAWDFPHLSDPAADARRALAAARLGVDGFSADIETTAERTYLTARRVAYYLALVRAEVGSLPVIATVPRPTAERLRTYPYAAEAPYVDVFAPMVYWSCTEPGAAVAGAITALARLRPVAPIGQAYDMGSEGGRHGLPSAAETWRFLDVARRMGAIGASLYDYESSGPQSWRALAAYPWP
ncbi:MAG TPA: hypothetical protein VNG13_12225 [Mycobacteriales bacterium]|nr:hypothetical protein [Mycobacteriales bacterium]